MPAFKFNVGSAVNGQDKALSRETVSQALYRAGFTDAEIIKEAMSDTETTYVIVAFKFRDWYNKGHEQAVYSVCEAYSIHAGASFSDSRKVSGPWPVPGKSDTTAASASYGA